MINYPGQNRAEHSIAQHGTPQQNTSQHNTHTRQPNTAHHITTQRTTPHRRPQHSTPTPHGQRYVGVCCPLSCLRLCLLACRWTYSGLSCSSGLGGMSPYVVLCLVLGVVFWLVFRPSLDCGLSYSLSLGFSSTLSRGLSFCLSLCLGASLTFSVGLFLCLC